MHKHSSSSMATSAPLLSPLSHPNFNTKKSRLSLPLSLLPKCTSLNELKQIQAYSIKTHFQNDILLLTQFINFCTKEPTADSMDHAHQLFDQISEPEIILFNFMVRGYARAHTPIRALTLFIKFMCFGLVPDSYTFPSLFKACTSANTLEEGKQLHCLAIKYGLNDDEYVCPALINMYTECSDMVSAQLVFDRIVEPCVVNYNAIITSYVRSSQPNEALLLFRELQAKDLKPTDVTMLAVVSSCALLGTMQLGKWVHTYVKENGFDKYVKVNTALIDMFAKCGSLGDAVNVFEEMGFRDTQAWSAMIMAYAIHGHGHKAISLFDSMDKTRVKPDRITFLGLLYACNHAGLVEEGCKYFYSMNDKYGVAPDIKHYGCFVDLLGRSGRLDEAYKFIEELPINPTPILWRTLLAACSSHGNVSLGKRVIGEIFELDEGQSSDYVIFSNMCARAGKWEDAMYARKLMKERCVVKEPGCSLIEVDNIAHKFFSGGGRNIEHKDLHNAVDELIGELKLVGYVPDVSLVSHYDMRDEEREIVLRYHSEKLAIMYGILNTRPGETIRVVKNLRICGDCHSAAKLTSLISGREIVIRDVRRFHHFVGGKCSCGDYW